MKNKRNTKTVEEMIKDYTNESSYKADPNGSYTGKCEEKHDKPVQDADDL